MKFSVPDMSCGHCTAAIEKAVKAADPAATINCDVPTHVVSVDTSLSGADIGAAIKAAGYESETLSA